MREITAILPAFNEEISIGSIVLRTKQYVDRIIVIDDGSSDHTAEVAGMAGAEVIRHPKNMGKGAALKTGFESLNQEGIIVTMDTDGQHDPADIPRLVEPIINGEADMVNGSRYLNGNRKDTPMYRRVGQVMLDKATNINSGLNITDSQSGFRAFADYTKDIFRFGQNGLAIESEMLADAANSDLRIKEVEIGVRYDVDCSTEHPVKHGIQVLLKVLQDLELRKPLYYFTLPGILATTLGIGMGLELLRVFFHGGSLYIGPTLLMVLLTLLGCFLALTGIILHHISKLMINVEKTGFKEPELRAFERRHDFGKLARDN
ncbi:MAG: glycosyltransferase family 2 protein [Methanothrix sp.]|nr:MAG: glycosyltransferase family 2 protein [Methanothrix sp.]